MERWQNKIAIVTGASDGIGAAIAEKLVEAGLQVVGLARRSELIVELSKKLSGKRGKLYAFKADMRKEDEILNAFKWTTENVGPVSILINNAGVMEQTGLIDGDTEKWRNTFEINVIGLCIATREAIKIMQKNNIDGHIVHMSSLGAYVIPDFPSINVYPASKHAVRALTETLRQELVRIGSKIKISSISPGMVRTKILINEATKETFDKLPMSEVQDVADAVMYMLSTPPHVQIQEMILKCVGHPF